MLRDGDRPFSVRPLCPDTPNLPGAPLALSTGTDIRCTKNDSQAAYQPLLRNS
jgi:hypothetical protein